MGRVTVSVTAVSTRWTVPWNPATGAARAVSARRATARRTDHGASGRRTDMETSLQCGRPFLNVHRGAGPANPYSLRGRRGARCDVGTPLGSPGPRDGRGGRDRAGDRAHPRVGGHPCRDWLSHERGTRTEGRGGDPGGGPPWIRDPRGCHAGGGCQAPRHGDREGPRRPRHPCEQRRELPREGGRGPHVRGVAGPPRFGRHGGGSLLEARGGPPSGRGRGPGRVPPGPRARPGPRRAEGGGGAPGGGG